MLDPLNVASAFIPVVGEARFAALAGCIGVGGARAVTGAVEGAVGAAILEPIVLAGARYEQADYDIVDSLANIAFGAGIGAGLHFAGGALKDRIEVRRTASPIERQIDDLPRADQEALARTAVAQMSEGRPVDVGPVMDASPAVREVRVEEQVAADPQAPRNEGPVDLGDGAPPLPPDTVRLYHGGDKAGEIDGPMWVTRSFEDAQGWAARSPDMGVWYVDVPANDARIAQYAGDVPNGIVPVSRFELPAELAKDRKLADRPADPSSPAVAERAARAEREAAAVGRNQVDPGSLATRVDENVRYSDPLDAESADVATRRVAEEQGQARPVTDEV
jgi:hypothetical protein